MNVTATVSKMDWTKTTATVIGIDYSQNATATATWAVTTMCATAETAMIGKGIGKGIGIATATATETGIRIGIGNKISGDTGPVIKASPMLTVSAYTTETESKQNRLHRFSRKIDGFSLCMGQGQG